MQTNEYRPGQWIAVDTMDDVSDAEFFAAAQGDSRSRFRDTCQGFGKTEAEAIADLEREIAEREAAIKAEGGDA